MCKVSIVMPSLNVAEYISETIESVISQTIRDIEIICVDAGSTDGTLAILEDYASRDERIRLVQSEKKSYGYQMNIGIAAARGEYIGIVETDDYIEKKMYESLYNIAVVNKADIVKADFDVFTKDEAGQRLFVPYSLKRYNRVEYGKLYSRDDYISGLIKPECYIWNAIYKREFLAKNRIRFNETPGASFQDFSFRYQTIYKAERIVATDKVYYHYRRDNITASTYNSHTVEYNLRETEYTLGLFEEKNLEVRRALSKEIIEFAFWPYMELLKWGEPSDATKGAYERYREIISYMLEKAYVSAEDMDHGLWLDANLLRQSVDVFMGYAAVIAGFDTEKILNYVSKLKNATEVVLFGTGVRGNAIHVFLKANGVSNITALCDNQSDKVGKEMYGTEIMSVDTAVKRFPEAIYILTSSANEIDMSKQLEGAGIQGEQIISYPLMTDPLFCTNCMIREKLKKTEE